MESCPRKQHLDSVKQSSFESHTLNNVTNTLSKSATLNVTSSRLRHGEVLNVDFPATMVSTTSAPTPSATTSPFYLLRDDPRELITSYFCMNSVTEFLWIFFIQRRSFFAATPLETNGSLLHGFDQTQKGKKVKEGLSSFLPHLPGKASSIML